MPVFSHFAVASLPSNTARHLGRHSRPGLGEGVGSGFGLVLEQSCHGGAKVKPCCCGAVCLGRSCRAVLKLLLTDALVCVKQIAFERQIWALNVRKRGLCALLDL